MKENQRNEKKQFKLKQFSNFENDDQKYINLVCQNQQQYKQGEKNEQKQQFDQRMLDATLKNEYEKSIFYIKGHKYEEGRKILVNLMENLLTNGITSLNHLKIYTDVLLNYWKILSINRQLTIFSCARLQKAILLLLRKSTNFQQISPTLKKQKNILILILLKQMCDNNKNQSAENICQQFFTLICSCEEDLEIIFKFRYIRWKIYFKLGHMDRELDEINACELILQNIEGRYERGNFDEGNKYFQEKNIKQIKNKLDARKNQLLKQVNVNKKSDVVEKNSRESSRTFKMLNIQADIGDIWEKSKIKRQLSLSKRDHYSKKQRVKKELSQGFHSLSNGKEGNKRKVKLSKKIKENNQYSLEKSRQHKKITKHNKSYDAQNGTSHASLNLLTYKKLTKKPIHNQYKEENLQQILCTIKIEENKKHSLYNYKDLLIKRPREQTNMQKMLSFQNCPELNKNKLLTSDDEEKQMIFSQRIVEKKELTILNCVKKVEDQIINKFFFFQQNKIKISCQYIFAEFLDFDKSSQEQSFQNNDDKISQQSNQQKQNEDNVWKEESKEFELKNICLPFYQFTFTLKITIKNQDLGKSLKCCLFNEKYVFFFKISINSKLIEKYIFEEESENINIQIQSDNDGKIQIQSKHQNENENEKLQQANILENNALLKQNQLKSYLKYQYFIQKVKETINFQTTEIGIKANILNNDNQSELKSQRMKKIQIQNPVNYQKIKVYQQSLNSFQFLIKPIQCNNKFNKQETQLFRKNKKHNISINYNLQNVQLKKQQPQILNKNEQINHNTSNNEMLSEKQNEIQPNQPNQPNQPQQPKQSKQPKLPLQQVTYNVGDQQRTKIWKENNIQNINQFLMKQKHQEQTFVKQRDNFYIAVKCFLSIEQNNQINSIKIFFSIKKFIFLSNLGNKHSKNNKVYKITVTCYSIKDLYKFASLQTQVNRIYKIQLPQFIKFTIEEKQRITRINHFVITNKDIENLLQKSYQLKIKLLKNISEQNFLFHIFQKITNNVQINKKLLYNRIGIVNDNDEVNKHYYGNLLKYVNNNYLLNPTYFLSPFLDCIRVIYQKTLFIRCDTTFVIVTILKIVNSKLFDIRIYVPKFQRSYSFTVSYKLFLYFDQEKLCEIFERRRNQINDQTVIINDLQNPNKLPIIWGKIVKYFEFYRKYNKSSSFLIVKICNYEAFTSNSMICQYFSIEKPQNIKKVSRRIGRHKQVKKIQDIFRFEIYMENNQSFFNFKNLHNHAQKRKAFKQKTINLRNKKIIKSYSYNKNQDLIIPQNYYKSLRKIYQSETNKNIVYISIINIMSSQKVVYSYFLCQLTHLLDEKKEQNKYKQKSTNFFKQKTYNHSSLLQIFSVVKNRYLLNIQSQATLYIPQIFKNKQEMQKFKEEIDRDLLKKKYDKISLNTEISHNLLRQKVKRKADCQSEISLHETEKQRMKNLYFLHKKVLLNFKTNPISCIIYNIKEEQLKILLNNYEQHKISQIQICLKKPSIPQINLSLKPLSLILKAARARIYRYYQNLILFM